MSIAPSNESEDNSIDNSNSPCQWVSWSSYSAPQKREVPINPNRFTYPIRLNETKIDVDDADFKAVSSYEKQEFYSHLKKVNIGRWNGKWEHAGHEGNIFKKNLCEILAGHLDLKSHQKSRIPVLFLSLDLRRYRTYDTEVPLTDGGIRDKWPLIIFCICILVCWEDGRVFYPDPNTGDEKRDTLFEQIAIQLKLPDRVVVSCLNKLQYDLRDKLGDRKDPPNPPIDGSKK